MVGGVPAVPIPQKDADVVDNEGLAELHLDPRSAILFNGVSREAMVQVVVLSISIQQRRLQLTFHHLSSILHRSNVLLRNYTETQKNTHKFDR